MKYLLLVALVLGLLFGGIAARAESKHPSRAEIIQEIEYARSLHQAWVDYLIVYPDYDDGISGGLAWQKRWVEVYEWVIYYLKDGDEGPPRDWRIEQGLIKEE